MPLATRGPDRLLRSVPRHRYGTIPTGAHVDHEEEALRHLSKAMEAGAPGVELGVAGVHAVLHLADAIRHGLRDIVYELRS